MSGRSSSHASPSSSGAEGWTDAESAALRAMCDALPEGIARFRSVETTGMGRNDYYLGADLAVLAFQALRALPVEQRMEAMGMRYVDSPLRAWIEPDA